MFGLLRILIGIVVAGISSLLILKFAKKQLRRKFFIITYISVILLITLLGFVPFENLVHTFSSPEEAFNYYLFSKVSVDLIVEGEQSALLVALEDNISQIHIVPKTAKGWKIASGLSTKIIAKKMIGGISVDIYQYKNTNDYFVNVTDIYGGDLEVTDDYGTEFYALEDENYLFSEKLVNYYAHISDFEPQYSVVVNGNKITFKQGVDY